MPFENESGDPNLNYLADGLTESLINGLSHTPGLRVIARNTVVRYRNSNIDVVELGSSLGVGKLLFGRVRLSGEAFQEHSLEMYTLGVDPRFKSVKRKPRFQDLISRVRHSSR